MDQLENGQLIDISYASHKSSILNTNTRKIWFILLLRKTFLIQYI